MVDPDILRQKSTRVLHHIERLRDKSSLSAQALRQDEDAWNALLMDLQQAIQGCIDLAVHWCVNDRIGSPSSAAESFAMLSRAGKISVELGVRLAGAAGLRNLIVHQYGELDFTRVLQTIQEGLPDLESFIRRARED